MRFFAGCCLTTLLLVLPTRAVAAETVEDWTGFWDLAQESEEGDGIFHLWVSATGGLVFFDQGWNKIRLASTSGLEGENLKLSQYFRGGQVVWSGRRDGDSLEGEWEFLHFQYHTKGPFSGTRLSAAALADWDPLRAGHAAMGANGLLNLTRILQEHAGDEAAFREYYESSFVPGFLAFLRHEVPSASVVWAALQDEQQLDATREFEENVTNLLKLLKRNFPSYDAAYRVVILPVGEERWRTNIGEGSYMLVNPDKFVSGLEGDKLRLSEKFLAAQLYPYTRAYADRPDSVYKMGLELFLLEQAYPEELPLILGVSEKRLVVLEEQLPKFKERMGGGKKLKPEERRYLSLAFARALAFSYPFQGVLKSQPQDIAKRLVEYLHVTGSEQASGEKPKRTRD